MTCPLIGRKTVETDPTSRDDPWKFLSTLQKPYVFLYRRRTTQECKAGGPSPNVPVLRAVPGIPEADGSLPVCLFHPTFPGQERDPFFAVQSMRHGFEAGPWCVFRAPPRKTTCVRQLRSSHRTFIPFLSLLWGAGLTSNKKTPPGSLTRIRYFSIILLL